MSSEPDPHEAAETIAGGPPTPEGPGSPRPARNAIIAAVALCLIVSAFFLSYSAAFGHPAVRDMTIAPVRRPGAHRHRSAPGKPPRRHRAGARPRPAGAR